MLSGPYNVVRAGALASGAITLSASSPMTETMAEGVASAAACMLSPRSFTSFNPSSKLCAASAVSNHEEEQEQWLLNLHKSHPIHNGSENSLTPHERNSTAHSTATTHQSLPESAGEGQGCVFPKAETTCNIGCFHCRLQHDIVKPHEQL